MPIHSTTPLWIARDPLVLASRSASRQKLLRSAGVAFEAVPADIDERAIEADMLGRGASPQAVGMALAHRKAETVARRFPRRMVLAADQVLALGADHVLALGERVFAKPADRAAAAVQLADLSGRTHRLYCSMVVRDAGATIFESSTEAVMTMRALSPAFIAVYLDAVGDAATTSVGGYQFEGLGIHLFETFIGDQSTILGLSLLPLVTFLRAQGSIAS